MDGQSGRPGGSGSSGVPALTSYSGDFFCGTAFNVSSYVWLTAFWWPVPEGGATDPQQFALWQLSGPIGGAVVPAATVMSGTLTAGGWNRVALPSPLQLSPLGIPYLGVTGFTAAEGQGFPMVTDQFGAGNPYSAGIVNGPLTAYSDVGGSNPVPDNWIGQGSFGTAAGNASFVPNLGSNGGSNFFLDLEVTDTAPAGASYRLRAAQPQPSGIFQDSPTPFTLALEIGLSEPCTYRLWFYSPAGVSVLPTQVAVYSQATQLPVAGSLDNSPAWSGAAGSGWVSCDGLVTLPAGSYRPAVCSGPTSTQWNDAVNSWWGGGGPASSGITNGPLSAPGENSAGSPGQASYNSGAEIAWPGTYNSPGNGSDYLVDIEVTPAAVTSGQGLMMASFF
jgi:hypothetical protein